MCEEQFVTTIDCNGVKIEYADGTIKILNSDNIIPLINKKEEVEGV